MCNFQPISRRISETVQDTTKVTNLLLMTNRNLHMLFRLVPKSSTLDDLELLYATSDDYKQRRNHDRRTLAMYSDKHIGYEYNAISVISQIILLNINTS